MRNLASYILLDDRDGTIVDKIAEKCDHKAEKIVKEIMKHWIRENDKVSWETLIDALRTVGLTKLATCIDKSL